MKKPGKSVTTDPRVAYFDRCAANWDGEPERLARTNRRLEECRGLLALRAGESVLEVGCGTGQITGWLCAAVGPGKVLGVDFSAEMLARARAKHLPAEFRLLDICAEVPPGAFDVALCFHAFPHFRDKPAALENLAGALTPAGRLIVMHLAGRDRLNAMHTGFGGAVASDHVPAADAWPALLAPAGLEMTELIDRDELFFLRAVRRTG